MDEEEFIIAVYCCIEDLLCEMPGMKKIRLRGPQPQLTDGEVLCIETVGEFLGMDEV